MNRSFALAVVLVFLIALVLVPPATLKAQSKTIVVPDDYPTVGAATVNAADGDTVYVKSGTYEESTTLTLNTSISLIGENVGNTTLNLNPPYGKFLSYHLGGTGLEAEYTYYEGMKIDADNVKISSLTINCDTSSITVTGSRTQITNNNLKTSIFTMESTQQTITGNNITKDLTSESTDTTIANNTMGSLISLGPNVRITDNLVYSRDPSVSMFLFNSYSQVEGNVVFGQYGITLRGTGSTVSGNMVVNTQIALMFDMDAGGNTIYHNNFINNTKPFQLSAYPNNPSIAVWDKGPRIGGNYWSDYLIKYPNASEIDSSGLGNTAYVLNPDNRDNYPLTRPLNITLEALGTLPLPYSLLSLITQNVPPKTIILSPTNQTYNQSSVPLEFFVDKQIGWAGYSLDGTQNVTISGNSTIANVADGLHTLRVYVNDTFGNTGASEPSNFTVALPPLKKSEPFRTAAVAAVSGAVVIVAAAGLLLYFKKKRFVK